MTTKIRLAALLFCFSFALLILLFIILWKKSFVFISVNRTILFLFFTVGFSFNLAFVN